MWQVRSAAVPLLSFFAPTGRTRLATCLAQQGKRACLCGTGVLMQLFQMEGGWGIPLGNGDWPFQYRPLGFMACDMHTLVKDRM